MWAALSMTRRPPLWLAACAVAAGSAAAYGLVLWVVFYSVGPVHVDVRMYYVAAEAGTRFGWSRIYDQDVLRWLSAGFPPNARLIDSETTYASLPLLAWLFAPLTLFSEPVAYGIWTVLSVVALIFAWQITAPYAGLAKWTLLFVPLALWPAQLGFMLGQPTMLLIALVAASWWLGRNEHQLAAGLVLAVATFLKPQSIFLLPLAIILAGRYRIAAAWAIGCAALCAASALSLGPSGLSEWWQTTKGVQQLSVNTEYTLAHVVGNWPVTYFLWAVQAAAALFVARRRRGEIEVVFAVGVVASVATAAYFHESDYVVLILPVWLVLRTSPPLWHRLFLLTGLLPMQLLAYWADPHQVVWTALTRGPQLLWDAVWLGVMVASCFGALGAVKAGPSTTSAKPVTEALSAADG